MAFSPHAVPSSLFGEGQRLKMFNNAEQKGPKSHKVQPGAGGRFSEAPSTHLLRCLGGYHWVASHASQIGGSTENEQESPHLKVNSSVAFSTLTM